MITSCLPSSKNTNKAKSFASHLHPHDTLGVSFSPLYTIHSRKYIQQAVEIDGRQSFVRPRRRPNSSVTNNWCAPCVLVIIRVKTLRGWVIYCRCTGTNHLGLAPNPKVVNQACTKIISTNGRSHTTRLRTY